ncbi:hypothetical protein [Caminibacter mediatlanticus]|uniref:Outer membrane cobalamin receptor protein-like protein n=1 Tax=Caminibacter mediatlanticus TB-2 TaxID=391592 RepID=A0AAI9AG98_9BACT|nr:hypothetical protein [Caminibacter mediatlanticus]EDM23621.1 Outer membrane cobalamin receptor protein-like protein [Caminibacter mediatlanticus TB-2]
MKKIILLILTTIIVFSADLNNLLNELCVSDDLSQKTKKENAGYVIVYTREDLDNMKILSLKEILEQIPFFKYNEDSNALIDLLYLPFQPKNPYMIKLIINDNEVTLPIGGDVLQIIGQITTKYIDHIEIYIGMPSFEISQSPAWSIIKIYTKKGYRENSNILGGLIGSRKLNEEYISSGFGNENKSYYLFFANDNIYRKNYTFNKYNLNRNIFGKTFVGSFDFNNFELFSLITKFKKNSFIGNSFTISPINNYIKPSYYLFNINYKKNNFKILTLFQYVDSKFYQKNDDILGYYNNKIYYESKNNLKESIYSIKISNKFTLNNSSLFLQGNLGKDLFNIQNYYDGIEYKLQNFNKIYKKSIGCEYTYLLNQNNLFTLSYNYKIDNYINIKKFKNISKKVGYIYNDKKFTFKTFYYQGSFIPTPEMIFINKNLSKIDTKSYSFKAKYNKFYFLYTNTKMKNVIVNIPKIGLINDSNYHKYNNYLISYTYIKNKIKNNIRVWRAYIQIPHKKMIISNGFTNNFFFNKDVWSFYTSLIYYKNNLNQENINLNTTISKKFKNIEVYFKGINILNKTLETEYISYNPLTNSLQTFKAEPIERVFVGGIEWKF